MEVIHPCMGGCSQNSKNHKWKGKGSFFSTLACSLLKTLKYGHPAECTLHFTLLSHEGKCISTPTACCMYEGGSVLFLCHGTYDMSHAIIMSAY